MSRIFCDMTTILAHARKHATVTGIQRVVLRVVGHLVAMHGPDAVRGIAWHPKLRRVVEIDLSFIGPDYRFEARRGDFLREMALPDDAGGRKQGLLGRLESRRRRLRWGALGGAAGHEGRLREPSLQPDDGILVLAPNFRNEPYIAYLASRKAVGNRVFQMIHDVIPLLKPWLAKPGHDVEFRKFLERAADYVSGFLCVSDQTEADLRRVMPAAGGAIPTRVVPLAHEFMGEVEDGTPIAHSIRALAEHPFVLCVGTIEVRKNTLALCKVWAQLRQDIGVGLPRLVLAGQRGWLTEDVFDLLRATGNLGGYVAVAERPSDAELAFLYRNCRFTVFPSLYEGWGLPIGESLWFGKLCITSKTSSMPQVGGDLAEYVDPHDLEDMRRVIGRAVGEGGYIEGREQAIKQTQLRRWRDVGEDVYGSLTSSGPPSVGTYLTPVSELSAENQAGDP
ncbi:glycosyltransferase family 4 protein [Inquilinus limosus]|uniref:glycosyltransferase family 4 protein n=1 Tax=Inquilinus limosus TaxID=171674 RepID=UPI000410512B|nr:glycosyltransferase family 1 protein [Inquilinus limosus]